MCIPRFGRLRKEQHEYSFERKIFTRGKYGFQPDNIAFIYGVRIMDFAVTFDCRLMVYI